jgi:hypothetical protein
MSAAGYKADARYYRAQLEDIISILKHGCAVHGEWFVGGKRVPGGDHSKPLPEGVEEWGDDFVVSFAEMERLLSILDGCKCQFKCGNCFHQVGTLKARLGVIERQITLIERHGKNVCDSSSNEPKAAIERGIAENAAIEPGSRGVVLFLAKQHQEPRVPKKNKDGWWATGRNFYGHFTHEVIEKSGTPEANGFAGSSSCFDFVGTSDSADATKAKLLARRLPDMCPACRDWKFLECVNERRWARVETSVKTQNAAIVRTQLQSLDEWGEHVGNEKILAIRVDRDAVKNSADAAESEDAFWLAKPIGAAFTVPQSMVLETDQFEEGWLVVRAKWYKLVTGTLRSFTLLKKDTLIPLGATSRLRDIKFSKYDKAKGRYNLSTDEHERIKASL